MDRKSNITPELLRQSLIYDPETGNFVWRERPRSHFKTLRAWSVFNGNYPGKVAGHLCSDQKYWVLSVGNINIFAHRAAIAYVTGQMPLQEVDHINGIRDDNRFSNLRQVSTRENRRNSAMTRQNTSGCTGVSKRHGIWRATIKIDNKQIELGTYVNLPEAIAARKAAEKVVGFHPNHGRPQHEEYITKKVQP